MVKPLILLLILRLSFNWPFFLSDFFSFIFYDLEKKNPWNVPIQEVPDFQNSEWRAGKEEIGMPCDLLCVLCLPFSWLLCQELALTPKALYNDFPIVTILSPTRSLLSASPSCFYSLTSACHSAPWGSDTLSAVWKPHGGLISYSSLWHLHWLSSLSVIVNMSALPPCQLPNE